MCVFVSCNGWRQAVGVRERDPGKQWRREGGRQRKAWRWCEQLRGAVWLMETEGRKIFLTGKYDMAYVIGVGRHDDDY